MDQARYIISKFGRRTDLARALGHKHPSTVQRWQESGFIPPRHWPGILQAAAAAGIDLCAADFSRHLETGARAAESKTSQATEAA